MPLNKETKSLLANFIWFHHPCLTLSLSFLSLSLSLTHTLPSSSFSFSSSALFSLLPFTTSFDFKPMFQSLCNHFSISHLSLPLFIFALSLSLSLSLFLFLSLSQYFSPFFPHPLTLYPFSINVSLSITLSLSLPRFLSRAPFLPLYQTSISPPMLRSLVLVSVNIFTRIPADAWQTTFIFTVLN